MDSFIVTYKFKSKIKDYDWTEMNELLHTIFKAFTMMMNNNKSDGLQLHENEMLFR